MILPALAAVVALVAGHPVPVVCATTSSPAVLAQSDWTDGETITVAPFYCSLWTRPATFGDLAGVGETLIVAVHEAEHIRYHDGNEAVTECRTMRDLPGVIRQLVPGAVTIGRRRQPGWKIRAQLWDSARVIDAETPAQYHGATCPLDEERPGGVTSGP